MKAKSKKKTSSKTQSQDQDIVSLILRDHKPIKELITILKNSEVSIAKKRPAFEDFEQILTNHAKAEEESLYVYLKQVDDLRVEGLEGDTEHAIAEQLIKDVNEIEEDDDAWMAKVKVLAEMVDHHVKEEEKDVLKEVKKEFNADERTDIGTIYSQRLETHRKANGGAKKYASELRAEHA